MISPVNFHGYTAQDPLDRGPVLSATVLTMIVSGGIAALFLNLQSTVEFRSATVLWVACAIWALAGGAFLTFLRKSSSFFFVLVILVVGVLIDIRLETHFRVSGHAAAAWWNYRPGSAIGSLALPRRFFAAWAVAGIILGPLTLWIARLVAAVVYRDRKDDVPTAAQRDALFPEVWTNEEVASPGCGLGFFFLRVVGLTYAALGFLALVGMLGPSVWPRQVRAIMLITYDNPALAIDTLAMIGLMALLAMTAAYNRGLRWYATLALLVAHLFAGATSLMLYLSASPVDPARRALLCSVIIDAVLTVAFIIILIASRGDAKPFRPEKEYPDLSSLPDTLTRLLYQVLGCAFLLRLIITVLLHAEPEISGTLARFSAVLARMYSLLAGVFQQSNPQLGTIVGFYAALTVLSFLLVNRTALRGFLSAILVFGIVIQTVASAAWALIGPLAGSGVRLQSGAVVFVDWYFVLTAALGAAAIGAILGLRKMSYDIDFMVTSLSGSSARNVVALSEAFFGGSADDSAALMQRMDRHVAGIRGRKRGLLSFPFWIVEEIFTPIYGLHPPFSLMSSDEGRYFLRKSILRPPSDRAAAFVPALAQGAFMIGQAVQALVALARFGYTGDGGKVGYVLPDARDRLQGDYATAPPPLSAPAPLPPDPASPLNLKLEGLTGAGLVAPRVFTPNLNARVPDEVDYVVIGSGAGGACLAYRLACAAGDPSRVLVLDRGPRYLPAQDFNDDEMEMLRKLYKEGGLQNTKRFDLVVLQGECVGGTTVINNAVCFEMPEPVKTSWQNEYDIDLSTIDQEYAAVASEIGISQLPEDAINQRVKARFMDGVEKLNRNLDPNSALKSKVLDVNHRSSLGDGCDNLGNKRLRKRSMLETYLPWSEARGVQIVSDTSAVRFSSSVPGGRRADSVLLSNSAGGLKSVRVRKGVIVSGGVIASSNFLMSSDVKGSVGRNMSCNFAFPVAFDFPDILDAFDGSQMTVGAEDPQNRAIFETFFGTPAMFAISLPFYFSRLQRLMSRYRYLVNFGTLIGSEPNGVVERTANPLTGRSFTWELGDQDRARIRFALTTVLEMGMLSGAKTGILPSSPGLEIPLTRPNLDAFKAAIDGYRLTMADMRMTTAHPQGGNRMTGDNSAHAGSRVVDSQFRVAGFDNVFVADGSLFPTGITVNPQWTIMAMASLAAKSVLRNCE